jgi:hypothetical protein
MCFGSERPQLDWRKSGGANRLRKQIARTEAIRGDAADRSRKPIAETDRIS